MRRFWLSLFVTTAAVLAVSVTAVLAQPPVARPQPPPPVPGAQAQPTQPKLTAPVQPKPTVAAPAPQPATAEQPPDESQLGVPVFPTARYLGSYDAGLGQRFYLYGSTQTFAELVAYYRTVLKDKGELVFDVPAVHMFEVGKFRETDVAFPPGVTVKDYTTGGSPGYMNPKPGATPTHFPTVIQIVPPPPAPAGRGK
ncbi:MAG: hypothetical protein NTY02_02285 [Acidobacteria bacterium]|nr:hypothetical protein [Acidobacteriota bacterium]